MMIMMRSRALYVGVLFGLVYIATATAIFEHQAGERDWYQSQIGNVFEAKFSKARPRYMVVASEAGVLASLSVKSGNIRWRHVLADGEALENIALVGNEVVSVSRDGNDECIVRAWSSLDGRLSWSSAAASIWSNLTQLAGEVRREALHKRSETLSQSSEKFQVRVSSASAGYVFVMARNHFTARMLKDGQLLWTWKAPDSVRNLLGVGLHKSHIHVVGIKVVEKDLELLVSTLNSKGRLTHEQSFDVQRRTLPQDILVLSNGIIAVLDRYRQHISLFDVNIKRDSIKIETLLPKDHTQIRHLTIARIDIDTSAQKTHHSQDPLLLINVMCEKLYTVVMRVPYNAVEKPDEAAVKFMNLFEGDDSQPIVSVSADDSGHMFVSSVSREADKLRFSFDIGQSTPLTVEVPSSPSSASPRKLFVAIDSKSELKSIRPVLVSQDHSISMIRESSVQWTRHEALASVTALDIVDRPQHSILQSGSVDEFPGFFARIDTQIELAKQKFSELSEWFSITSSRKGTSIQDILEVLSSHRPPPFNSARFGLHKVILAMTRVGVLYGIDSRNGVVLWSTMIASADFEFQLFETRKSTASLTEPPECIVVAKHTHKRKPKRSIIVRVNPIDGSVSERKTLDYHANHVFRLPALTQAHQALVLLIDVEDKVHMLTPAPLLYQEAHRTRLFVVSPTAGTLQGLSLQVRKDGVQTDSLWSFVLPDLGGGSQIISDYALAQPSEMVFEQSVDSRAKYLSKNMVAFTCVVDHSDRDALVRDTQSSVAIYILDAATGRILHHGVHADASGPAAVVQSEHFIIYSFFNAAALRHEIVALELFHDEGRVEVLQKSFVIETGVVALGVSQTLQSVSEKQILLGLASGQVVAVDRSILNPRRPLEDKLTPAQKAAGLIPYSPLIPINPMSIPSYHNIIHRLSSITASPTMLESTSLILCSGLDMFFTPITPSRPFDTLKEDFNLPFLILTVTGVGVGIFITRRIALAKKLSFKWE